MARITTGDCERFVPNRFELVLLAAERAHRLNGGAQPLIAARDRAMPVLALREIASGRIDVGRLRDDLIGRFSLIDRDFRPLDESSAERLEQGSWPGGVPENPPGGKAPAKVH